MKGWEAMDMRRELKGLTWGVAEGRYEVFNPYSFIVVGLFSY